MIAPGSQSIYDQNRYIWNRRVLQGAAHTRMASEHDFQRPLQVVDPRGWLGKSVHGRRVLCLAAGGGLQSVLLASAGAEVTVVDLSPAMLEQDRRLAASRGLPLRLIEGSMDDLSMLGDACFDVVIQPVSTCYVPDIVRVYKEVARVIVASGLYLSQHKQPTSLQASAQPGPQGYTINEGYYRHEPLPPVLGGHEHRESGAVEFLHRWEQLIGSLCRSGFVIEDLQEPNYADPMAAAGTFQHRSQFIPPYVAIKARRSPASPDTTLSLFIRS
ncbi:class I SAM-dependent methyltransferase [Candidatus Entotheonella palauensis]|uniref:SAM-dependent methlyltransferase n=1 Tax=Candidatus Entotheonella gemina TaxID=1429439 RepID=W4LP46_9BACT|nr:class I SAM-dependent methyltransferase [Candidatus Entotheonella palauensis]ETW99649.1 MAG: SAM-dependent methlyltransferase [Candidatus Entotheonella gemina]